VGTCRRGVDARREKVDIPSWRFALPEREYQACTMLQPCNHAGRLPHVDQRRTVGESLMVQHNSKGDWPTRSPTQDWFLTHDVFRPTGRIKMGVTLSAKKMEDKT